VEVLFDTFHVRATAELVPVTDDEIEVVLRVDELPLDVELRITGNVEISDEKVHEWAGVGSARSSTSTRLRASASACCGTTRRGLLLRGGAASWSVRPARTRDGEATAPDVIFEIKEGPRSACAT
jgi:hypothetical protein